MDKYAQFIHKNDSYSNLSNNKIFENNTEFEVGDIVTSIKYPEFGIGKILLIDKHSISRNGDQIYAVTIEFENRTGVTRFPGKKDHGLRLTQTMELINMLIRPANSPKEKKIKKSLIRWYSGGKLIRDTEQEEDVEEISPHISVICDILKSNDSNVSKSLQIFDYLRDNKIIEHVSGIKDIIIRRFVNIISGGYNLEPSIIVKKIIVFLKSNEILKNDTLL